MAPTKQKSLRNVVGFAFVWMYFALSFTRPQDYVSSLSRLPMAKIAGVLAILAFLLSLEQIRWPLPRNTFWLFLLLGQLFATVPMSPVWRTGAFQRTLDVANVVALFVIIVSFVTTLKALKRLILIQCSSAVVFCGVSLWNARLHTGRLESGLGNVYSSNPNDLALGLVTVLPLSLALVFLSRGLLGKTVWILATLLMIYAVLLTGSRGGFISLLVAGIVCLWDFAIRGRRAHLLLLAGLAAVMLWQSSSLTLMARLKGTFDPSEESESAYSSAQQRKQLFWRSVEVTEEHPFFGVGPGNFQVLSGNWHETHNAYTQMSSEGGLPALVLYLLFIGTGFKNTRRTEWLAQWDRDAIPIALALRASLISYLAGACFASVAYDYPYVLVGYTTALVWIAKRSAFRSREPISSEIPSAPDPPLVPSMMGT